MERDYSTAEVAELLGVTEETVRRYIRTGSITGYRLSGPRSQLRITAQAIRDYREQQQRLSDPWIRTTPRRRKSA